MAPTIRSFFFPPEVVKSQEAPAPRSRVSGCRDYHYVPGPGSAFPRQESAATAVADWSRVASFGASIVLLGQAPSASIGGPPAVSPRRKRGGWGLRKRERGKRAIEMPWEEEGRGNYRKEEEERNGKGLKDL